MPLPKGAIPGQGPLEAPIALIGEQPGKQEVISRECFVGPAGRELNNLLRAANIPRTSCYITNVIKDLNAPLKHYIEFTNRGPITGVMWQDYLLVLKEELEYVRPYIVVAVGGVALYALTGRTGITKWRGSIIESTLVPGLKVIPTLHPATVIPPKNQFLNKYLIQNDLIRAREHSGTREMDITERTVIIRPNYYQVLSCLEMIQETGHRGQIIDFDIEVVRGEVSCLSFAWSPTDSICIPFTDGFNDYFTVDQEAIIMRMITQILEDPLISKRGQNFAFDSAFMFWRYGILMQGDLHDTMISQKITMPDFPVGLDFITSIHTDIPYYKAEGKKYFKVGGPIEKFWQYNGMDTISTAAAHPQQIADLIRQNNVETYNRQRKILYPLVYMSMKGIKIDLDGMKNAIEESKVKLDSLENELFTLAGRSINWNSPQQMKDYFYSEKGEPPYKKKNSKGEWKESVDVDALKRLARKGYAEASIISKLRNLKNKVLGTYLDLEKIDTDGRFRSYYNPVGGETGRLSSSENIITETGGNQQNIPHWILEYYIADPGYVIYSIDLSQIENRIVAYVGKVISMIQAFEDGIDLHSLTASLIFDKSIGDITRDDYTCDLGDGSQSERFWGKKANHGLNYGLGYKNFALRYEMPESEAKWIIDRYHSAYPGVREGFHQLVKSSLYNNRTLVNLMGRSRVFLGDLNDSTFKEAYAQIPQSTVADVINERGLNFVYYNQQWFRPVELLAQIHDAIDFQIPLYLPWETHAEILLRIKRSLETPLSAHGREFVVPADVAMGLNMCKDKMKDFKSKKVPNDIEKFAKLLEEGFHEISEAKRNSD